MNAKHYKSATQNLEFRDEDDKKYIRMAWDGSHDDIKALETVLRNGNLGSPQESAQRRHVHNGRLCDFDFEIFTTRFEFDNLGSSFETKPARHVESRHAIKRRSNAFEDPVLEHVIHLIHHRTGENEAQHIMWQPQRRKII